MVIVLSRLRVANGMEEQVAEAFRARPRSVESAPGFLWLEVFRDAADATVFYLVTRWTDRQSFDRWHASPAHRTSHALIPTGLKLDPAWTEVQTWERVPAVTGTATTDDIVDAVLLWDAVAAVSSEIHFFVIGRDGVVRVCNGAASRHVGDGRSLVGDRLQAHLTEVDGLRLGAWLEGEFPDAPFLLNFAGPQGAPFTLECRARSQGDAVVLLAVPTYRRERELEAELLAVNQELAVLSRERSREARDERVARQSAERLNLERTQFLETLAHELRQPLGSAVAALGLLRMIHSDPRLERPRASLERQLNQLTRLVNDLADTARVTLGHLVLRKEPVDLAQLLRALASAWEAIAEAQHKTFISQIPEAPLMITADVDRLQQVFSNLVVNAFKYTPQGASIRLALTTDGDDTVAVRVTDEGEGIPADQIAHVFDLFHRATTSTPGLGVGLAVVRAVVAAHDGTVTADSDGPGQGATFTVRLPRLSRVATAAPR